MASIAIFATRRRTEEPEAKNAIKQGPTFASLGFVLGLNSVDAIEPRLGGNNQVSCVVVRLVTTRIVRKNTAAKHRRQKFTAAREFGQHGIILQGVRSDGPGPIVILAFRNDNTFPLRQV